VEPESDPEEASSELTQIRSSVRGASGIPTDELIIVLPDLQDELGEQHRDLEHVDHDEDVSLSPFIHSPDLVDAVSNAPNASLAVELAVDKLVDTTNSNVALMNAGYSEFVAFKNSSSEKQVALETEIRQHQDRQNTIDDKIERVNQRLDKLESDFSQVKVSIDVVQSDVEQIQNQVSAVHSKSTDLSSQLVKVVSNCNESLRSYEDQIIDHDQVIKLLKDQSDQVIAGVKENNLAIEGIGFALTKHSAELKNLSQKLSSACKSLPTYAPSKSQSPLISTAPMTRTVPVTGSAVNTGNLSVGGGGEGQ
jgi:archaellum component FlaC